jgi:hypothetical protein
MMIMRSSLWLVVVAACSTTAAPPPARPGSRGPRADEHLEAAVEHARRADELSRWPDARRSDTGRFDDPSTGLWYRNWDSAKGEARMSAIHRSEAARLQAEYEAACVDIPPELVQVSPLQRYGVGGTTTKDGVTIYMEPEAAPPADRLLAEMRCHRAWMMLGGAGMDACPLDLAGIQVQAHGDQAGVSVEITIDDPALVPELQRRAAMDLEVGSQRRVSKRTH